MEELRAIIRSGGRGLPFLVAAIVLLALAVVTVTAEVANAETASTLVQSRLQAERLQAEQTGPCGALVPSARAACAAR
ncbi:MAG: hypothetical protein H7123_03590, partial [Thermoleophilia bacterium]|nr:hypothetical protein [Thermoleophilia bacterium]